MVRILKREQIRKFRRARRAIEVAALPVAAVVFTVPASAGTVILEGSDAIGYHWAYSGAAQAYANQTWTALGGSSSKPIAVVGNTAYSTPLTSTTHSIVRFSDLSSAGSLADYVAVYFLGDHGCCTSGTTYLAGRQSDLSNYVTGGGTVEIGNYEGDSTWDFLVGGSGHNAYTAGFGAALSGPGCTDGERVTALGQTNGFTQPSPMGCWTHQAYAMSHFASFGFTQNFFDADPAFAAQNSGFGAFSSLLSNGSTQTGVDNGAVPEPATWLMMIAGFGLLGAAMRRHPAVRVTYA